MTVGEVKNMFKDQYAAVEYYKTHSIALIKLIST